MVALLSERWLVDGRARAFPSTPRLWDKLERSKLPPPYKADEVLVALLGQVPNKLGAVDFDGGDDEEEEDDNHRGAEERWEADSDEGETAGGRVIVEDSEASDCDYPSSSEVGASAVPRPGRQRPPACLRRGRITYQVASVHRVG